MGRIGGRVSKNGGFQKKSHDKLTGKAPKINADEFKKALEQGAFTPEQVAKMANGEKLDPWDGKKRLDAGPKALRVPFTEDDIQERRIELEKRIAQTALLRAQHNTAKNAAKAAKDALSVHIAGTEGYSAITKQGWEYKDVDCVTVLSGAHAVAYRTDTGEEISRREATSADLQDSIPGV
jgi:hypothetical protein